MCWTRTTEENVRECDVFVMQTACPPFHDRLMELLIVIDALKYASTARITAVIPYYMYARSDKKDQPRISITARLVADLLEAAGCDRILTMNLYSAQTMGFARIPVDQLDGIPILCEALRGKNLEGFVAVAPDVGRGKVVEAYARRLGLPVAILGKERVREDEPPPPRGVLRKAGQVTHEPTAHSYSISGRTPCCAVCASSIELTQRIAFTRGADEEQEIYLIDADGSNEFQLTHNHVWDGEVAWSPSGSRLAFVRAIPKREYATQEVGYLAEDEIWVVNSDGSSPRLLLNSYLYKHAETLHEAGTFWFPEGLRHLHWTPDESWLFAEGIAWVTSNAIWSVNVDGTHDGEGKPLLFPAQLLSRWRT